MFGNYPQATEPQLVVTFMQYSGADEATKGPRGERFVDNRKFEGPIPTMLDEAVSHIMGRVGTASLIDGLLTRDIPEYPRPAVREALLNAVAHRDYSAYMRGSQVQVKLFADRLEISSPGGLFGDVTLETLEERQSTRNLRLMQIEVEEILAFVRREGFIANGQCRELLGIASRERVRRLLGRLVDEGRLERVGQRRGARYVLAGAATAPRSHSD